jgi:hypothetical protein
MVCAPPGLRQPGGLNHSTRPVLAYPSSLYPAVAAPLATAAAQETHKGERRPLDNRHGWSSRQQSNQVDTRPT